MSEATGHDRICERADTCDKLNSDGEPCRHGTPHEWDQGCDIECRSKSPFGTKCMLNSKREALQSRSEGKHT